MKLPEIKYKTLREFLMGCEGRGFKIVKVTSEGCWDLKSRSPWSNEVHTTACSRSCREILHFSTTKRTEAEVKDMIMLHGFAVSEGKWTQEWVECLFRLIDKGQ